MSDLQAVPPRDMWTHRAENLLRYYRERKLSDHELAKEFERVLRSAYQDGERDGAEGVRREIRNVLGVAEADER
jgi:hypothetical protein